MADTVLNVELRQQRGKGVARKLRAAGRIPGVCYGRTQDSVPVALDPRSLERLISKSETGMNTLIDLKVEGGGSLDGLVVLVREIQRDPVRNTPLHADFYAVDLTTKTEVSVPIHLVGRPRGVEFEGGILDHALRELEIECLPRSIPKEIVADVSELDVGDSLHVRDLVLPEGVDLIADPNLSVVSVVAPTVEEVPVEEAAEVEGAEPAEGEAAAEGDAAKAEESSDEKSGE